MTGLAGAVAKEVTSLAEPVASEVTAPHTKVTEPVADWVMKLIATGSRNRSVMRPVRHGAGVQRSRWSFQ